MCWRDCVQRNHSSSSFRCWTSFLAPYGRDWGVFWWLCRVQDTWEQSPVAPKHFVEGREKFLVLIKCSLSHRLSSHESPSAENNHTGGNWKQVITTYIWFCCQAATSSGCSDYYIWKRGSVWFLFLDKDSVLEVILDIEPGSRFSQPTILETAVRNFFLFPSSFTTSDSLERKTTLLLWYSAR